MYSQVRNNTDNTILLDQGKFSVSIATDKKSIDECLRLRYDVFANEMGANLHSIEADIDKDGFDDHCKHLMIIEKSSDRVIATTRLLSSSDIVNTGGFYSETEFDMSNILNLNGSIMEVGRTCIHKDFRRGVILSKLWQGIAFIVSSQKIDFLIGCSSIPLSSGDQYINVLMHHIHINHYSKSKYRVHPWIKLSKNSDDYSGDVIMPALLKGYLRQGAVICGEPYWDAEFGVADVFVFLDCKKITNRYSKYFMDKISA